MSDDIEKIFDIIPNYVELPQFLINYSLFSNDDLSRGMNYLVKRKDLISNLYDQFQKLKDQIDDDASLMGFLKSEYEVTLSRDKNTSLLNVVKNNQTSIEYSYLEDMFTDISKLLNDILNKIREFS